jgi:hypothetical protein
LTGQWSGGSGSQFFEPTLGRSKVVAVKYERSEAGKERSMLGF